MVVGPAGVGLAPLQGVDGGVEAGRDAEDEAAVRRVQDQVPARQQHLGVGEMECGGGGWRVGSRAVGRGAVVTLPGALASILAHSWVEVPCETRGL